ncbi:MAG: nitroreductase family protein [Candidatus Buchananbacteria bacterium]|nr:nitroreductase family protein [Candidatus Buchananbacteria bacterium]
MSKFPYPENPAPTDAQLLSAIKRRWSPLAFSSEPIEAEKITALFEAMRWTQSSRNEQPWRIIYATKDDGEIFDQLASLLTQDNGYLKDAYMLMLVCAVQNFAYKNLPNRMHQYDTGAAAHALFLQAVDMGLVAHEVGGFDKEKPYELFKIPKEVSLLVMMGVGYPGDESKVDPALLKKRYENSRVRRSVTDFAFRGKWLA